MTGPTDGDPSTARRSRGGSVMAAERIRPRWPGVWLALMAGCTALLALGVVGFIHQTRHGFITTSLRTPGYGGAAWGLYIAFDAIFVGLAFGGIALSCVARIARLEVLQPVTRLGELCTLAALSSGSVVVLMDLGRPLDGLLKLPRFARPWSPFFGTFTLVVAGFLFSSLVYLFLGGRHDAASLARSGPRLLRPFYRLWASGYRGTEREKNRHYRVSFWLALAILPVLVLEKSTLGLVFGLQAGRPGWFGALQAPGFVVLAAASGLALVILTTLGLRALFDLRDQIPDASIRWMANAMWVLVLVYLYFTAVEMFTDSYAAPAADRRVAHEIVAGSLAPLFWFTVACLLGGFLIPFVAFVRKRGSMAWMVVASVLVVAGAVTKRVIIVVPSQTLGALLPVSARHGSYVPSWVELAIIGGLVGLVGLVILGFARIFPVVPSVAGRGTTLPPPVLRADRSSARAWAAGAVTAVAVALMAIGLADSFRLWSGGELDPVVPYSPVIFATGLMALFASAVVYEVFPERSRGTSLAPKKD